jgi:hypothetical protein
MQTGELLLAAGGLQPRGNIPIAGVRVGDRRVRRDGLFPVPGVGGRARMRVAGRELQLAAGVFQLSGGGRVIALQGEDLSQQVDRLLPPFGPECGQRLVVERLHLGCTRLLPQMA